MAEIESFQLDHTRVTAPYVRLIGVEHGPAGDAITNFDVRFVQPNVQEIPTAPAKSGIGAGGVIAIILGVAAAAGVLYAAWQTLRADDELWVADDPLRAPDA